MQMVASVYKSFLEFQLLGRLAFIITFRCTLKIFYAQTKFFTKNVSRGLNRFKVCRKELNFLDRHKKCHIVFVSSNYLVDAAGLRLLRQTSSVSNIKVCVVCIKAQKKSYLNEISHKKIFNS